MDFPIFFLDFFGNRLLIAVMASIHIFINHPLAVGAYPLVALLEWWGWRRKDANWDYCVYRMTFVLLIITTTVGALTGVGIWLTTALIAPFGIGSLLRVFFWYWFTEWLVFISEVVLVLAYFLTWKRWREGIWKKVHIVLGAVLGAFSWLTMMIITGILGFMMDPGKWPIDHSLLSAFFNPIYLPQLAFRTTYAMGIGGLCIWFLLFFFTGKGTPLREKFVRMVAIWILAWVIPFAAACHWYWRVVPEAMKANIDVAMLTQRFMQWHQTLAFIMVLVLAAIVAVALIGAVRSRLIPGIALLIPFVLGLWLLGHFERIREFIRKPYVIADYMYSNGVKVDELPIFQRDGILPYATFVEHRTVTSQNITEAGRDVFLVACSRCHTTTGINSMVAKFTNLYGTEPWDENALAAFIYSMHNTRTFMPPFPGNDREAEALVAYLKRLQVEGGTIFNAQTGWTLKPQSTQPPGKP